MCPTQLCPRLLSENEMVRVESMVGFSSFQFLYLFFTREEESLETMLKLNRSKDLAKLYCNVSSDPEWGEWGLSVCFFEGQGMDMTEAHGSKRICGGD